MTEDVIHVLTSIRNTLPLCNIYLAGYSAGSNIVQNVVLTKPASIPIVAVFCCCVNWCYTSTRTQLEGTSVGRMYSMLLAAQVKVMRLLSLSIAT
jgi:predicted alpha/beta-fold hydrolase